MKTIPLTRGQSAMVSDADHRRIAAHRWQAILGKDGSFRAMRTVKSGGVKRNVYMHHEVLGIPSSVIVDHKNRNSLDNRRSNLRRCTKAQNAWNGFRNIKNKTSGFKGVSLNRHRVYAIGRPWRATITVFGKQKYLGWFSTEKEAAMAYDMAARKHFGRFAACNFEKGQHE
jgi:hypothetical protein